METMSTPEFYMRGEPLRPLKRVEYERLAAEGFFEDEKVELLFGMVVPMTPIDPAHAESTSRIASALRSREFASKTRLRRLTSRSRA